MKNYIMAFDQGTTSSRTIIFDKSGKSIAAASREFTQYFPKEGYVEHDPMEILESQLYTAKEALQKAGLTAADIAALGITNQRETTVVWDKATGKPIYHAIVWQCRRTEDMCAQLSKDGKASMIKKKTGLAPDPYFSATKLAWLLQNVEGARQRAACGELLFGTVDTWLLWHLTGGKVHATDPSNAARTMLFNINTLEWDKELLALFDIPASMLPRVLPSVGQFGHTAPALFGDAIPICGIAGDQQAALFGQCCFEPGAVKNTYGTGGFLLMNTGETPMASQNGLLTTIGWQMNGKTTYVLEGSVFVCGAAIGWLRDGLGLIASSGECEALAGSVADSGGVYFVPAFVGLGTPHWNAAARGTICGLSRGTTRAHLVRATLDAMALQTTDVLAAMKKDTGLSIPLLRVDGGASKNNLLLQLQSNYADLPILRPASVESTAWGVAAMAGLGCGVFQSTAELTALSGKDAALFHPNMAAAQREQVLEKWQKAVAAAIAFV